MTQRWVACSWLYTHSSLLAHRVMEDTACALKLCPIQGVVEVDLQDGGEETKAVGTAEACSRDHIEVPKH